MTMSVAIFWIFEILQLLWLGLWIFKRHRFNVTSYGTTMELYVKLCHMTYHFKILEKIRKIANYINYHFTNFQIFSYNQIRAVIFLKMASHKHLRLRPYR